MRGPPLPVTTPVTPVIVHYDHITSTVSLSDDGKGFETAPEESEYGSVRDTSYESAYSGALLLSGGVGTPFAIEQATELEEIAPRA